MTTTAHLPRYCDRALGDQHLLDRGWTIAVTASGRTVTHPDGGATFPLPPACVCTAQEVAAELYDPAQRGVAA